MNRRDCLKQVGAATVSASALGLTASTTAAASSCHLDVYVYSAFEPTMSPSQEQALDEAYNGLLDALGQVDSGGHLDSGYLVHQRWDDQSSYPEFYCGTSAFTVRDWLRNNGYTEGDDDGTAATHLMVDGRLDCGGEATPNTGWPDGTGLAAAIGHMDPYDSSDPEGDDDQKSKAAFIHETFHTLIDESDEHALGTYHANPSGYTSGASPMALWGGATDESPCAEDDQGGLTLKLSHCTEKAIDRAENDHC